MRHSFVEPIIAKSRYTTQTRTRVKPSETVKAEPSHSKPVESSKPQTCSDSSVDTPKSVKPPPNVHAHRSLTRSLSANQIASNQQTAPSRFTPNATLCKPSVSVEAEDCEIVAGNLGPNGQVLRESTGPNTPPRYCMKKNVYKIIFFIH